MDRAVLQMTAELDVSSGCGSRAASANECKIKSTALTLDHGAATVDLQTGNG
jgi:hypothetical protein